MGDLHSLGLKSDTHSNSPCRQREESRNRGNRGKATIEKMASVGSLNAYGERLRMILGRAESEARQPAL